MTTRLFQLKLVLIFAVLLISTEVFAANDADPNVGAMATVLGAGIAFVGALVGASTSLLGIAYTARKNRQIKHDELFISVLDYFTGGSQKRSAGIAGLEFIVKKGGYGSEIIYLAISQTIYLISESGQGDAAHEALNLERLLKILIGRKIPSTERDEYNKISTALGARIGSSQQGKGISVDKDKLIKWKKDIDDLLAQ
jgi:hypothetical protein